MNGTTDLLVAATRLTNDLMASPGHKANIPNANFTHVGIGSWHTAPGQTWSSGGYPLMNVFSPPRSSPTEPLDPFASPAAAGPARRGHLRGRRRRRRRDPRVLGAGRAAVDSYAAVLWDSGGSPESTSPSAPPAGTRPSPHPNGKQHYVTVHGHNAAGWGGHGASAWVTVAAVPGPPTEVRAVPANASVSASGRSRPTRHGDRRPRHVHLRPNGYTGKYAWVCATWSTDARTGSAYAYNAFGFGAPVVSSPLVPAAA